MKRIGFMGCGVVATYGHLPAVMQTPGLELVSVFDPNQEQLSRFREKAPSVQGYTDVEAFFQSGIDAVAILSPAPRHLDNVRAAARYGKHVLCEKPLAMNDADINEMIDIMENAGLMLSTAFCYRFSPVALKMWELVREGAIGDLRALRLIYLWDLHGKWETDPTTGNRIESPRRIGRMLEGGPMVDCGVHQIDLALWWLDSDVVRQQSSAAWIDGDYEAPEHVWLHMDHANGAHTAVEMSFSYCHTVKDPLKHFSYHLIGNKGLLRYDRDNWHFELRNEHGTFFLPGSDEKNFTGMYHAWRDALETGKSGNLPSGREGLRVTRIARAATDEVIAARSMLTSLTTKP